MKRQDIMYYLGMLTIFTFFFIMIFSVYLITFDGSRALTYPDTPMPAIVMNEKYVDVTVSYCKEREIPFTSRVSYVNGVVYNLPEVSVAGSPVGCRTVHKQFTIPVEIPPGTYRLNVQNTMEVNKLRTITASYTTELFEIIREIEVK